MFLIKSVCNMFQCTLLVFCQLSDYYYVHGSCVVKGKHMTFDSRKKKYKQKLMYMYVQYYTSSTTKEQKKIDFFFVCSKAQIITTTEAEDAFTSNTYMKRISKYSNHIHSISIHRSSFYAAKSPSASHLSISSRF